MDFQYITAVFNGYYTTITEQIEQFAPEVHIRIMDLMIPEDVSVVQVHFGNSHVTSLNQYVIMLASPSTDEHGRPCLDVEIPQQFVNVPLTIKAYIYLPVESGGKKQYRIEVPVLPRPGCGGFPHWPPPVRPGHGSCQPSDNYIDQVNKLIDDVNQSIMVAEDAKISSQAYAQDAGTYAKEAKATLEAIRTLSEDVTNTVTNLEKHVESVVTEQVKEQTSNLVETQGIVQVDETGKIPKELLPDIEATAYWDNINSN